MTTPARTRRPSTAADTDAREFGLHMKQGGWRLGLLVARNVIRSPGRVSIESLAPKTNATHFAQVAHTSNDRVLRHLNAWEAAADAGLVPHAAELSPGTEIDIDADTLPSWTVYYRPEVRRSRPIPAPVTTTRVPPTAAELAAAVDAQNAADIAAREAREAARQQQIAAETQAQTASEQAIDDAGRRYRQAMAGNPVMPSDSEGRNTSAHGEILTEVTDLLTKTKWFTRRLFDLARDPAWDAGQSRDTASAEIRALASQLNLVADLAADPDSGRLTDETASHLLEG